MYDSKSILSSNLLLCGQSLPWETVLPPYNSWDGFLCNQNVASSQERDYQGVESLEQHRVGSRRGAEISLGDSLSSEFAIWLSYLIAMYDLELHLYQLYPSSLWRGPTEPATRNSKGERWLHSPTVTWRRGTMWGNMCEGDKQVWKGTPELNVEVWCEQKVVKFRCGIGFRPRKEAVLLMMLDYMLPMFISIKAKASLYDRLGVPCISLLFVAIIKHGP